MARNKINIPDNFDITKATSEEFRKYRWAGDWNRFVRTDMLRRGFIEESNDEQIKKMRTHLQKLEKELVEVRIEIDELRLEESESLEKEAAIERAMARQQELHKERLLLSRIRREQKKKQRIRMRALRLERWQKTKDEFLLHIGPFDSSGLQEKSQSKDSVQRKRVLETDTSKLQDLGLPLLIEDLDLLAFLQENQKLTMKQLRFLCFRSYITRVHHYHRFSIPKKTGGERHISAPHPLLRQVQRQILDGLLQKVPVHQSAHGFVSEKSIVSNARPHIGKDMVINMDLKNFFPTITFQRVRGMFRELGYSGVMSQLLSVLCTEVPVREFSLDNQKWYQKVGTPILPQGSPASPMITNIICRKLDRRLEGLAKKLQYTYTRYADDLTFSTNAENPPVRALLAAVNQIVTEEGFEVHPQKTKVMRKGACKEVTGIVVNEYSNVSRRRVRSFRAYLHHVSKHGIEAAVWEGATGKNSIQKAIGFASFVHQVRGDKGENILQKCLDTLQKYRSS